MVSKSEGFVAHGVPGDLVAGRQNQPPEPANGNIVTTGQERAGKGDLVFEGECFYPGEKRPGTPVN